MELVKSVQLNEKELRAIELLPINQKPLILALIDYKILAIDKVSANKTMLEIQKETKIDSGSKNNQNSDLVALSISSYDLIADKFQNLTMSEFKAACKKGVIGDYGEWFGMCLKSINQWIKGYLNNEVRSRAIKEWNAKIAKEETRETPVNEKIEISKPMILNAFNHFKLHGTMPVGAYAFYDILNELIGVDYKGIKTLVTDRETRLKLVEEVEGSYLKLTLQQIDLNTKRKNFDEVKKLQDSIDNGFKESKTLTKWKKEAFLKHYFNQLIEEGKQLEL